MGAYADERIVAALKLVTDHGPHAEAEATRRMEEAAKRSSSEWRKWLIVRDSLQRWTQERREP